MAITRVQAPGISIQSLGSMAPGVAATTVYQYRVPVGVSRALIACADFTDRYSLDGGSTWFGFGGGAAAVATTVTRNQPLPWIVVDLPDGCTYVEHTRSDAVEWLPKTAELIPRQQQRWELVSSLNWSNANPSIYVGPLYDVSMYKALSIEAQDITFSGNWNDPTSAAIGLFLRCYWTQVQAYHYLDIPCGDYNSTTPGNDYSKFAFNLLSYKPTGWTRWTVRTLVGPEYPRYSAPLYAMDNDSVYGGSIATSWPVNVRYASLGLYRTVSGAYLASAGVAALTATGQFRLYGLVGA
jgi:hypothetical protein